MKCYYKVIGQVEEKTGTAYYVLGYTTAKKAFTKHYVEMGWKKEQLIFIKKFTQSEKEKWLNK